MDKKGFTIVEVLAIIVILGVISVISIPNVARIYENQKTTKTEEAIKLISLAAEAYSANYGDTSKEEIILISDLIEKGYIDSKVMQSVGDSLDLYQDGIGFYKHVIDGKIVFEYKEDTTSIVLGDITTPEEPPVEEPVVAKVYGVTFDPSTSAIGTRTDDAVGLSYTVNTSTIDSDFDTAEIYSEITEVTDSYGNVFVKIPKFYIKKTSTGNDNFTYQISKDKQDADYYLPLVFNQGGAEQDYFLVGKYNASLNSGKLESKTGKSALVNVDSNTFRSYAEANGAGYHLIDIYAIDVLQTLFYIEYATLDSQSIMRGNVSTSGKINTGSTDSVATASGSDVSNSDSQHQMKYRGIESLYGNIQQIVDGVNFKSHQAYYSTNPDGYQSDVFTGDYQLLGYGLTSSFGTVNYVGLDPNMPAINFPTSASSGKYGDYYWAADDLHEIAVYGGCWNSTDLAGIMAWSHDYSYNGLDITIGSRLMKFDL